MATPGWLKGCEFSFQCVFCPSIQQFPVVCLFPNSFFLSFSFFCCFYSLSCFSFITVQIKKLLWIYLQVNIYNNSHSDLTIVRCIVGSPTDKSVGFSRLSSLCGLGDWVNRVDRSVGPSPSDIPSSMPASSFIGSFLMGVIVIDECVDNGVGVCGGGGRTVCDCCCCCCCIEICCRRSEMFFIDLSSLGFRRNLKQQNVLSNAG